MTKGPCPTLECPCDGAHREEAFTYEAPPQGETGFVLDGAYRRAYDRCRLCGHWFSRHDIDLSDLYTGAYAGQTYGDRLAATFERIMALPADRSDNAGRAARILDFATGHFPVQGRPPRLLDVGSGLAVFPARMKAAGWDCTALDPDPRAAAHARTVAGVQAVAGDFLTVDRSALGQYDAVTFNKVLEHVEAPVAFLRAARDLLLPHGFLYVELPDGEAAAEEGAGREEFFIEHHHVFSLTSFAALIERAGFRLVLLERLREPSTKFTLRGFAVPEPRGNGK
ncbi:class I SAM-dependent methyltransferase [Azospirillum aestuarii]|uniref:class I SAM-dependent methyltransferase n=1 Tax=Azospirillum aestuarii TaxID=2802052 RepID=UPI004054BF3C